MILKKHDESEKLLMNYESGSNDYIRGKFSTYVYMVADIKVNLGTRESKLIKMSFELHQFCV